MVIGVGLASHNFRDAGAVGNGRHSGIADKRIDLSLGLEKEIPNLNEQNSTSGGYDKRHKAQRKYFQRITREELIRLGGSSDR